MKKLTIISFLVFVVGLVLFVLPLASGHVGFEDTLKIGPNKGMIFVTDDGSLEFGYGISGKEVARVDEKEILIDNVTSIDMQIAFSNLEIRVNPDLKQARLRTEDLYDKDGELLVSYDVIAKEDGELAVKTRFIHPIRGRSLHGQGSGAVLLEIPEDWSLNSTNIKVDMGKLSLYGLQSRELNSLISTADCELSDCQIEKGSLTLNTGILKVRDSSLQDIEIKVDVGDVVIKDSDMTSSYFIMGVGSLNYKGGRFTQNRVEIDIGDAVIQGRLEEENSFASSVGSIDIKSDLPRTAYIVNVESDVSYVEIEGGKANPVGAMYRIDINNDMGSTRLSFAAEST